MDGVDAVVAGLRRRGATITEAADQPAWGIRVAHLRDPDGHLIELATELES